jgi:hypothetical protein
VWAMPQIRHPQAAIRLMVRDLMAVTSWFVERNIYLRAAIDVPRRALFTCVQPSRKGGC